MLAKDSVQTRLSAGLSFTEFSYMLLQAADFRHLYRTMGVELQMGGADQWGNITAGLELIRRSEARDDGDEPAHGLAYRLLLDATGAKFGKTAAGTSVWLDPQRTSPYAFYQYWLDRDDAEAPKLLRFFTLLSHEEILSLEADQALHPDRRPAQRALARDISARVHGEAAAQDAIRLSEAAFSRDPITDPALLAALYDALDGFEYNGSDLTTSVLDFVVTTGVFPSRGEARRAITQGGLSINNERLTTADASVPEPIAGRWLVVRVGRKRLCVGKRRD